MRKLKDIVNDVKDGRLDLRIPIAPVVIKHPPKAKGSPVVSAKVSSMVAPGGTDAPPLIKQTKGSKKVTEELSTELFDAIVGLENRIHPNIFEAARQVKLNELSRKTLGSYVKKSADDLNDHAFFAGDASRAGHSSSLESDIKAQKRLVGIKKATTKLTKEDVLDEISSGKLNKYIDSAEKDEHKSTHALLDAQDSGDINTKNAMDKKLTKRNNGVKTALNKLTGKAKVNADGNNDEDDMEENKEFSAKEIEFFRNVMEKDANHN